MGLQCFANQHKCRCNRGSRKHPQFNRLRIQHMCCSHNAFRIIHPIGIYTHNAGAPGRSIIHPIAIYIHNAFCSIHQMAIYTHNLIRIIHPIAIYTHNEFRCIHPMAIYTHNLIRIIHPIAIECTIESWTQFWFEIMTQYTLISYFFIVSFLVFRTCTSYATQCFSHLVS